MFGECFAKKADTDTIGRDLLLKTLNLFTQLVKAGAVSSLSYLEQSTKLVVQGKTLVHENAKIRIATMEFLMSIISSKNLEIKKQNEKFSNAMFVSDMPRQFEMEASRVSKENKLEADIFEKLVKKCNLKK